MPLQISICIEVYSEIAQFSLWQTHVCMWVQYSYKLVNNIREKINSSLAVKPTPYTTESTSKRVTLNNALNYQANRLISYKP